MRRVSLPKKWKRIFLKDGKREDLSSADGC